jgi:hypothetical protein
LPRPLAAALAAGALAAGGALAQRDAGRDGDVELEPHAATSNATTTATTAVVQNA